MHAHVCTCTYNLLSPVSFLVSNHCMLLNEGIRPPSTEFLSVAEVFVLSEPPYTSPLLHIPPAADSHSLVSYPPAPSQVRYRTHTPQKQPVTNRHQ